MEIYLDNAATTKPADEVVEAMLKSLKEMYGNPSSLHRKGVEIEREIKKARKSVAKALGCSEKEVIFTSGGTEANNLAIRGLIKANKRNGNHLITSKIEHKSVLALYNELEDEGYRVTYLDVDENGFISLEEIERVISSDTVLVSIMHVNNEIGSIQPINEVGKIIKKKNPKALFHVDGVQSFGKIKFALRDLSVDSFSISGHKFHGPKGIGALYIKNNVKIKPFLIGGGQEASLRSGTENVPGILGLGKAVELMIENQEKNIHKIKHVKSYLLKLMEQELEDISITSKENEEYAPHIINVSLLGIRSEIMLHSLEGDGIYVSSGSACSAKKRGYSHVLEAMGMKEAYIDSAIRISLSYTNTEEEIAYAVDKIKKHLTSLRKIIKR
ncbi:cysteine desulfurase family protein [Natronincola ferrireducens]|uniref:Cysteine desulfurase n=1 Tax=Natronincola ferrireducens TaxID=393762 RepID=A0A1G9D8L2_9FIRM|nr:cysteine desulfurase family protein [Natronincola ferrireducens]SDK60250.1 cysteine desulfurase [Natronincola ferrireducens]